MRLKFISLLFLFFFFFKYSQIFSFSSCLSSYLSSSSSVYSSSSFSFVFVLRFSFLFLHPFALPLLLSSSIYKRIDKQTLCIGKLCVILKEITTKRKQSLLIFFLGDFYQSQKYMKNKRFLKYIHSFLVKRGSLKNKNNLMFVFLMHFYFPCNVLPKQC